MPRAKLARFLGRALSAAAEPWAREAPPQFRWPGGLAPVSEAGGPGLGSSLARACSAWPRGGFGLPGVVFFVPLSWFSTPGQKHGSDGLARLKPCF